MRGAFRQKPACGFRSPFLFVAAVLGWAALPHPANGAGETSPHRYRVHAEVSPPAVRLGERGLYRGWVTVPRGEAVGWVAPRSEGALTWGAAVVTRRVGVKGEADTACIAIPIQSFSIGTVSLPGISMRLAGVHRAAGAAPPALPLVRLRVIPTIAASDTAAQLKPLRGPLRAPWWERVPWLFVLAALLLIVGIIVLVRWLKRRRPVAAPAAPAPAAFRDPVAEALAELAALRRLRLPEQGRFDEHAFQLTRLLRRFLERTVGAVRPGLTSAELVACLAAAGVLPDLRMLETLLRTWDGIKFARAPSTVEEARLAETAVVSMLGPCAEPVRREVA